MKWMQLLLVFFAALPGTAGDRAVVRASQPVYGQYLVLFDEQAVPRSQAPESARAVMKGIGGTIRHVINNVVPMFSAEMSEPQAEALARHPWVLLVEEVAEVHISATQTLPPPYPLNGLNLWNLDRIDQWGVPNSNAYQYCERARDVIAYMADFGVMGDHQEFRRADGTSRVRRGVCYAEDCLENRGDTICPLSGGRSTTLNVGHGTAVASILGGNTVGVAKDVSIVPLRFYSCAGVSSTEQFNLALDWIRSPSNPDRNHRPALVSLSAYVHVTDPILASFEHVINGLVLDEPSSGWTGIPVIVSANNQGQSDCVTSPARMAYRNRTSVAKPGFYSPSRVISVGGTSRALRNGVLSDVRWQSVWGGPNFYEERCVRPGSIVPSWAGSNHGNMVDIYAPADNIDSAHTSAVNAYRPDLKSGTSFSAPLVAGIAARILQVEPNLTPTQVWDRIRTSAQHVNPPIDESGRDANGNPTSNDLLAIRRYSSATCAVEFP